MTITSFLGHAEDTARQRRESVGKRSGCKDAPTRGALRWSGEQRPPQDPHRSLNPLRSEMVWVRVLPGESWWCPANTAPFHSTSPAASGRAAGEESRTATTSDRSVPVGPHLCSGHVFEGHVSIRQLAGCNSEAVNIWAGVITLKVLREETFEVSWKCRHHSCLIAAVEEWNTCCSTSGLSQGSTFTLYWGKSCTTRVLCPWRIRLKMLRRPAMQTCPSAEISTWLAFTLLQVTPQLDTEYTLQQRQTAGFHFHNMWWQ